MLLVAFGPACRQQGKSSAILFVDVRQAFYRMIRAHVVSVDKLDESVARLFHTLRLPAESFEEFARELTQDSATGQSGMTEFMQAHIAESLSFTWFRLPQDERISQTRKGSRPGDNLADILFSFSFRRILDKVFSAIGASILRLNHVDSHTPSRIRSRHRKKSDSAHWALCGLMIWLCLYGRTAQDLCLTKRLKLLRSSLTSWHSEEWMWTLKLVKLIFRVDLGPWLTCTL